MNQKSQKEAKRKRKIVISGGHAATVAISIIEELIRRSQEGQGLSIYWIGSKKAFEGKNIKTLEHQVLPQLPINYNSIISGRLQRKFTIWTIPSVVKIPIGFFHAYFMLNKIKPDLILSLGGHAAFPVVVVGHFMKIPVFIHEQTPVIGRTNKASIRFSDKILLSRQESKKYFPAEKCIVVGHPVMTQITEIKPKKALGNPPILYVTGGSRGSKTINSTLKLILPDLLGTCFVIHQTGYNDAKIFQDLKKNLANELSLRYEVYANIDPMQIDGVYKRADLIIARAGASTVSEIVVTKRPSILIPLPISYMDEQMKNAQYAQNLGLAKIIKDKDLSPNELMKQIKDSLANWTRITKYASKGISDDIYASKRIVDLLEHRLK